MDTDVHGAPTRLARFARKIPRASRAMIKHERFAANLDFARTITHPKVGLEPLVFHYINSALLKAILQTARSPGKRKTGGGASVGVWRARYPAV